MAFLQAFRGFHFSLAKLVSGVGSLWFVLALVVAECVALLFATFSYFASLPRAPEHEIGDSDARDS
jgi:hypothetical protein